MLLHSRGGATGGRPARNTEYEKALITIVRRLRADENAGQPVIARILLDSQPARKLPSERRVLVDGSELSGLSDGQVVRLIRSRAKSWGQTAEVLGGNSTKALRIETQGCSYISVHSMLKLTDWNDNFIVSRLSVEEQGRVTSLHIDSAVGRLRANEHAPNFSESRDYDVLLDDGIRLAPQKVFGLALEEALGIEVPPEHFNAGWSQPSFRIIEAAGYLIVPKSEPPPAPEEIAQAESILPPAVDGSGMREGTLKLVMHMRRERNPRLSDEKKIAFTAEHGFLYCERCNMNPAEHYEPDVAAACIEVHHAKVQIKDMQDDHVTILEDLQCLCANCHRVTHRELVIAARRPQKSNSR